MMFTSKWKVATLALAAALCIVPDAHGQQQPAVPPLVRQLNNGNWLAQSEAEALRDELFYQRAVYAYMTMLEEYGWDRQCGLITTFKQTMYLVHNDWSSQGEPGRVRMVRQAVDQGKGVIFEALQSYLDGLRASGWGR